jgi:hypothetical protein
MTSRITEQQRRDCGFTVRLLATERAALHWLARHERRTPSDVVRLLIVDAMRQHLESTERTKLHEPTPEKR